MAAAWRSQWPICIRSSPIKSKWPKPPDVMYFEEWPVRQPSLLFAGLALGRPEYLTLWKGLEADPKVDEVIRNWPVRQPILWV